MPVASLALSLFLAASVQTTQAPPPETEKEAASDQVTVTGQRPHPDEEKAEEPYSTTRRIPLGSRIPRKPGRRVFHTVASNTGLAGLIAAKENDFDATGGAVLNSRNRLIKVCKADREEVSEETACALVEARRSMEAGDFESASSALAPLLASGGLSSFDRYYTGYYAYLLAQKMGDEAGRETALTMMLASGRMPESDRPAALKTLVAMAFKRGDDAAAIARLEKLVEAVPEDAQSQANLATLYANRGDHEKARTHMATAVALLERSGATPPNGWRQYLQEQKR